MVGIESELEPCSLFLIENLCVQSLKTDTYGFTHLINSPTQHVSHGGGSKMMRHVNQEKVRSLFRITPIRKCVHSFGANEANILKI